MCVQCHIFKNYKIHYKISRVGIVEGFLKKLHYVVVLIQCHILARNQKIWGNVEKVTAEGVLLSFQSLLLDFFVVMTPV